MPVTAPVSSAYSQLGKLTLRVPSEQKGKGIPEEIKNVEVKKGPAPTFYSRVKNVVVEAIQRMWSIFQ